MIGVLLVDDQPLVRAGLRVLFEGERDIAVAGEAANGEEAVSLAASRIFPFISPGTFLDANSLTSSFVEIASNVSIDN